MASSHNHHDGDGMEHHRAEQHAKFHGEEKGNMHESMTNEGAHNPELFSGGPLGKGDNVNMWALPEKSGKGEGGIVKACNMVGGSPD